MGLISYLVKFLSIICPVDLLQIMNSLVIGSLIILDLVVVCSLVESDTKFYKVDMHD